MKPYFSFQWHITDDCDQRCKHCYIFSENTCKKLDSMTLDQMEEVLANIQDFCQVYGRQPYLYLTGGDPILHPDFWRLLERLKEEKIPFTIMGNPLPFDGRKLPPDEGLRLPALNGAKMAFPCVWGKAFVLGKL